MLGAMFAAAAFNLLFDCACIPDGMKLYTQIATDAYIGAKLSKSEILSLKYIITPAVILFCSILIFSTGLGFYIAHISDLTLSTALFSMAPAGISDMTLASMDFPDSEPAVVALIQTFRIIFTVCLLPPLIKAINPNRKSFTAQTPFTAQLSKTAEIRWKDLFLTLTVGLFAGLAGKYFGIPGGTIIFPLMGTAAFHIQTGRGYMPLRLRQFTQIFAGSLIGCTVDRSQIIQIIKLKEVVIIAVASFILLDLVVGILISKVSNPDLVTALFSCAPGGLSDMALIAEDMGADSLKITGMHTVRLVGVVVIYPPLINLLACE